MEYEDRLWQFTLDPVGGTCRVAVFDTERELFDAARAGQPRGEVFRYFESRSPARGGWSGSRFSSWRYQAPSDPAVVEHMGRELWEALPKSLQASLEGGTPLRPARIKIASDARRLTDLPWEWMYGPSGWIALDERVRIVRSVPLRFAARPLPLTGPIRVLVCISNPKDERMMDSGREIAVLDQALARGSFDCTRLVDPTLQQLQDALRARPLVLHYVGHAGVNPDESGNLILPTDRGTTYWVDGPALVNAIPASVHLLCAATCFSALNYDVRGLSRFAFAPPDLALPTVVTNQSQPADQGGGSSAAFWETFYAQLAETGDIVEATHEGRRAAFTTTTADWGSWLAVLRDNTGRLFLPPSGLESLALPESRDDEIAQRLRRQLANDFARSLSSGSEPGEVADMEIPASDMKSSRLRGWSMKRMPTSLAHGSRARELMDSLVDRSRDE